MARRDVQVAVRVLVVEAPGVLYPLGQNPPNADPITSGLRLVRSLSEGYGVGLLLVAQVPLSNHDAQLRAWAAQYDVSLTWTVTDDAKAPPLEFWERKVMTTLGAMRATPPVVLTAHPQIAHMLASKSVPTIQFRRPDGIAPDWGPAVSSWQEKQTEG